MLAGSRSAAIIHLVKSQFCNTSASRPQGNIHMGEQILLVQSIYHYTAKARYEIRWYKSLISI